MAQQTLLEQYPDLFHYLTFTRHNFNILEKKDNYVKFNCEWPLNADIEGRETQVFEFSTSPSTLNVKITRVNLLSADKKERVICFSLDRNIEWMKAYIIIQDKIDGDRWEEDGLTKYLFR